MGEPVKGTSAGPYEGGQPLPPPSFDEGIRKVYELRSILVVATRGLPVVKPTSKKKMRATEAESAEFSKCIRTIISSLQTLKKIRGGEEGDTLIRKFEKLTEPKSPEEIQGLTELVSETETFVRNVPSHEKEVAKTTKKVFEKLTLAQRLHLRATVEKPSPRQTYTLIKQAVDETKRIGALAHAFFSFSKRPFERMLSAISPPMSDSLLYHIAGDPLGAKSKDLVGYKQENAITELADVLSSASLSGTEDFRKKIDAQVKVLRTSVNFRKHLETASEEDLLKISEDFRNSLKNLKSEESFVILGGWTGDPGHAMIYEVKPSRIPGKFEVCIHNAGAGIEYQSGQAVAGRREVKSLVIDNISLENLCNSEVMRILKDLQTFSWSKEAYHLIYNSLLPLLKGKVSERQVPDSEVQRSGTCSFASIFLYFQTKFNPEEFSRLQIAIELKAIDAILQQNYESKNTFSLILKIIPYTSQHILEAESRGHISQDEKIFLEKTISTLQIKAQKLNEKRCQTDSQLMEEPPFIKKETPPLSLWQRLIQFIKSLIAPSRSKTPPEYMLPFRVKPTFTHIPELSFTLPSISPQALKPASLFEVEPPTTIPEAIKVVRSALDWSKTQADPYETHIELGHVIDMVHKVYAAHPDDIDALSENERRQITHDFFELGRSFGNSILAAYKERGTEVNIHSGVLKAYFELIVCTRLIGKDIEEICRYPSSLIKYEDLKNYFPYSFENFKGEQEFFKALEKINEGNFIDFFSTDLTEDSCDLAMDKGKFNDFLTLLEAKYGERIKADLKSIDSEFAGRPRFVKAALFDQNCQQIAREILPPEFLDFKNLIESALLLTKLHGVLSDANIREDQVQKYFIQNGCLKKEQIGRHPIIPLFPQKETVHIPCGDRLFQSSSPEPFSSQPKLIRETPYQIAVTKSSEETAPAFQKLIRAIPSEIKLQIDSALGAFSSHPELFLHKEWRFFFERTVFAPYLWDKKLDEPMEKIPRVIASFLDKQLPLSLQTDTPEQALFCLRMYRLLYERVKTGNDPHLTAKLEATIKQSFEKVSERISDSPEHELYRLMWHYERAQFLNSYEQLQEKQLDQLIISTLYSAQQAALQTPSLEYDFKVLNHSVLSRNDVILCLKENGPNLIHQSIGLTLHKVSETLYESDTQSYDLVRARLDVKTGKAQVKTPGQFFASHIIALALQGEIPQMMEQVTPGEYAFSHRGQEWKIVQQKGELNIYKQLGSTWFQYIGPQKIEALYKEHKDNRYNGDKIQQFFSEVLFTNRNVWIHKSGPTTVLRLENKQGISEFETEYSDKEVHIYVCDASGKRTATQVMPPEGLPACLLEFEDRDFILPLSHDGFTFDEIRFPRLGEKGLCFQYDAAKGVFRNAENPSELLLRDQYIQAVDHLHHKLVIIDEKTRKKRILIPGHRLWSAKDESALSTASILYEHPSKEKIPLYSYTKGNGTLVTEDPTAKAYLAYTYLWQQQYEKCATTLEQLPNIPLPDQAIGILSWMMEINKENGLRPGHDFDARTYCLILKAASLLERQRILFQKQVPQIDLKYFFAQYKQSKHLYGSISLTKEECILLGKEKEAGQLVVAQRKPQLRTVPFLLKPFSDLVGISEAASPLQPRLQNDDFFSLVTFLKGNEDSRQRAWPQVQYIFHTCFSVTLKEYSEKEWQRVGRILFAAAMALPSDQQTATAILYAIYTNPDEFKGVEEKNIEGLFSKASAIFPKEEPSSTIKEAIEIPVEPEIVAPCCLTLEKYMKVPHDPMATPLLKTKKGLFQQKPLPPTTKDAHGFAEKVTSYIKDPSPLAQTACKEFKEAVDTYQRQHTVSSELHVEKKNLASTVKQLEKEAQAQKEERKKWKQKVQSLLKKNFPQADVRALQDLLQAAGYSSPPGVQDAVMCLLKPMPSGFLALNPALSNDDAKKLLEATVHYLLHKTYQQHLQTCLQTMRPMLKQDYIPSQEEYQALFELFQAKREYTVSKSPQNLVFETAFGHFLRQDQIAHIQSFIEGESKVLEIPMGAGKTSALLPIFSKMVADRGKLSINIIPEPLYPSMAPQIANSLQKSFGTQTFSWELKNNEAISLETLAAIESGLKNSIYKHQVVVIKPKDLTGLLLQFISMDGKAATLEDIEKTKLYQSIFQLLSSAEFLCDEFDTICDVLKEHILSVGSLVALDGTTIQVSAELMTMLSGLEVPKEPEEFRKKISPELIKRFVATLPAEFVQLITEYLQGSKDKKDIEHLPEGLRDKVSVARAQIQDILPETQTRVLKIHYGEGENVAFAIPYENGQPVLFSRFGHELEEVNYTLSMYLQMPTEGLKKAIHPIIEELKVRAQSEIEFDRTLSLTQTTSYVTLQRIVGDECAQQVLSSPIERSVDLVSARLEKNGSGRIAFVQEFILSRLERPETFARSTSQIYALLCTILRGFAGILWNKDTYPIQSEASPDSIGKTISIFANETTEVVVYSQDKKELFQPNHAIIGIGGVFKDENGEDVARRMLEVNDPSVIQGVIFYGKDKQPYVLERNKPPYSLTQCTIPPEHLTAFWAQAFTTGSDLKVRREQEGFAEISKDTILRDLGQGAWRFRKLGKGQKEQFVISEETKNIILKTLELPADTKIESTHVLAFVLQMQINRLSPENYRSVQQKAQAILIKGFLTFLLKNKLKDFPEAFAACRDLFIQKKPATLFEMYGKKAEDIETDTAINNTFKKVVDSECYKFLCTKGILTEAQVKKELEDIRTKMRSVLPDKVHEILPERNTRVQTQTQTRTQTKTAVAEEAVPPKLAEQLNLSKRFDQNKYYDKWFAHLLAKRNPDEIAQQGEKISDNDTGCSVFGDIFGFDERTKKFAALFSETIGTSLNLHQVNKAKFTPLTRYGQPFQYGLVISGPKGHRIIAVNNTDARELSDIALPYHCALMNIRTGEAYPLGTFYKQEKEPIEKELTNNLDLLTDRVCLKLFSGDLSLTPKERLALLMWGTKIGKEGCQRIADFLTEVVVPTNPEAAQAPALIQSLLADKGNGFVLSYIKSLERKGLLMQDTAARLTALVDKNADNNLPIELLKRLIHYSA